MKTYLIKFGFSRTQQHKEYLWEVVIRGVNDKLEAINKGKREIEKQLQNQQVRAIIPFTWLTIKNIYVKQIKELR